MSENNNNSEKKNRRDFLTVATTAVGAVGVGAAVWPIVNQMNPDASVKALASIEVDLSKIKEGQEITVLWSCLLYTSPSPRDLSTSRMPSSA